MNSTAISPILELLLGSRLRARLLSWLFSHPGERYFVRQLAALLQEDSTNLSRELSRLSALGILTSTREGHQKYYAANPDSPLYPELRGLILKTAGVVDVLGGALRPLSDHIEVAFVFGSLAAGKEKPGSDIDLLIVGDVGLGEIVEALGPVQNRLGREVNPVIYPGKELQEKLAQGHHFVTAVLEGPKLFVIGNPRELERLAQVRLAE